MQPATPCSRAEAAAAEAEQEASRQERRLGDAREQLADCRHRIADIEQQLRELGAAEERAEADVQGAEGARDEAERHLRTAHERLARRARRPGTGRRRRMSSPHGRSCGRSQPRPRSAVAEISGGDRRFDPPLPRFCAPARTRAGQRPLFYPLMYRSVTMPRRYAGTGQRLARPRPKRRSRARRT